MRFECTHRREDAVDIPVLVYRPAQPLLAISSGPLGGGIGVRRWVVNASVPMEYHRDDPDAHLAEIATTLGLTGTGVGFLTGVDVRRHATASDEGVDTTATVGLGAPGWAAVPADHLSAYRPGTVNIVVRVPVRLGEAALVNAVATATEAKAQALWELGLAATGTATDAVAVLCPTDGPAERYAGPRSLWGARLARAVHTAVLVGGREWLVAGRSWSDRARLEGGSRSDRARSERGSPSERPVTDRPSEPADGLG